MARNPLSLSQLTSLGEEVLEKASQNPTAARVVQGAMQMKDRVDDLARRVRGLEAMEKRIEQLEKRLAKLESARRTATPKRETPSRSKPSAPGA